MAEGLTLKLPNFQGPLDLLLHLLHVQKIDIYDIPIAQITKQYLAYLQKMQDLNLQIAGEYFVMSSTLLRIKSQSLLPKNDFVEDDQDQIGSKEELVQQLVQYSVFKKIAAFLKERHKEVPVCFSKEASIWPSKKVVPLPKGQVDAVTLANTFALIFKKTQLRQRETVEVKVKEIPLARMTTYLTEQLGQYSSVSFFDCVKKLSNLAAAIGLFLALLELIREKKIKVFQRKKMGDLILEGIKNNG